MICWMCRQRKTKGLGRCKSCQLDRCIACGQELAVFVRMIQTIKFRKRQWKLEIYEHLAYVKTRTYERLCVNPDCSRHWDASKLPPNWQRITLPKVELKKTFDQAIEEIERSIP